MAIKFTPLNTGGGSGGGSATINLLPKAAPVPIGEYVENIHFNTSLSVDEVNEILNKVEWQQIDESTNISLIFANESMTIGLAVMQFIGIPNAILIADMMTMQIHYAGCDMSFMGEGSPTFVGWNPDLVNPIAINDTSANSVNMGVLLNVGTNNNLLANVVNIGMSEGSSISLSGEYEGASLDIKENQVINVKSMIENDKEMPIEINVNVPSVYDYLNLQLTRIEWDARSTGDIARDGLFGYQLKLTNAKLTNCSRVWSGMFGLCINLSKVVLEDKRIDNWVIDIKEKAFAGCSNLRVLVLDHSIPPETAATKIGDLAEDAFSDTPIESGEGIIYVPDEMLERYKTTSFSGMNWAKYSNQYRPLSEYVE